MLIVDLLTEQFEERILAWDEFRGDLAVAVERVSIVPILQYLKNEIGFHWLVDLYAVDYPQRIDRFDVIYHLYHRELKRRVSIKVHVPEGGCVPSATAVWKGANWHEREIYDLFGVKFDGHPNLIRILCHKDFVGHALRKDYDAEKRQSLSEPEFDAFLKELESLRGKPYHQEELEPHIINIGPSHPATHGAYRIIAELDGETILHAALEIGYLHRCFEKMAETHLYHQVMPYTERLNYVSGPINNVAYAMAVEKLMQVTVPERAEVLRVIIQELYRIADHLIAVSTNAVDVGALTNFWYAFKAREQIYDLALEWGGQRMFPRMVDIGGFRYDIPEGWTLRAKATLPKIAQAVQDIDDLLTDNKIFVRRMKGAGYLSREDAEEYGVSGPVLRGSGVEYDVRKEAPYGVYSRYRFDVPVATGGDAYSRYLVRMEEMRQSLRILEQALNDIPLGPVKTADKRVRLPEKEDVYGSIEGLMHHFMIVMDGLRPPKGEIYSYLESANGEFGFHLVSDGGNRPYRLKVRSPSFANFQPFPRMIEGGMIPDAVAALGSMNIVAGELDR